MTLSLAYLQLCSAQTGYRVGPLEKVVRLGEFAADLNYLFRLPLVEPEVRELWQPGELDRPKVRVVGLEELLVGKLLALFDRGAVRIDRAWEVVRHLLDLAPNENGTRKYY